MKIGFLGLGQMGHGMAANLIRAGHEVTLYNRTPGKAAGLDAARAARQPAPSVSIIQSLWRSQNRPKPAMAVPPPRRKGHPSHHGSTVNLSSRWRLPRR